MSFMKWATILRSKGLFGGLGGVLLAGTVYGLKTNKDDKKDDPISTKSIKEKCVDVADSFPTFRTPTFTTILRLESEREVKEDEFRRKFQESLDKARDLCQRVKDFNGLPGLAIGLTVNGRNVWSEGFGFADIENRVPMRPEAIMRIASISKSMTMAMLGKLMEEGKIDIDLPIQSYLPDFPKKTFEGKQVEITTRDLLSHLSGIRHYKTKEQIEKEKQDKANGIKTGWDTDDAEFYLKDKFKSVEKALDLFKNDELLQKPGIEYSYTTHGWTVVSAIIEKLTETPFDKHAKKMFAFWGLKNTFLDEHEPLIYNRTRYYSKDKDKHLINSPYVDNSYKWAGGGFLSTVGDLTQFANMLLYSFQSAQNNKTENKCELGLPKEPYLKSETMKRIWKGDPRAAGKNDPDIQYGLGFQVGESLRKCMFCKEWDFCTVFHTGGAMGASSVLLVSYPNMNQGRDEVDSKTDNNLSSKELALIRNGDVKGICVAMITNLTDVGLYKTANEIANLFKWMV